MEHRSFWIEWPETALGGSSTTSCLEEVRRIESIKSKVSEAIADRKVTYLGSPREPVIPQKDTTPKHLQVRAFRQDLLDTPFAILNQRLAGCQIYEHIEDIPLPPI